MWGRGKGEQFWEANRERRGAREAEMIPFSYFWALSIISGCVPFSGRGYSGLPLFNTQVSSVYTVDFSFIRCKRPMKNFMLRSRINSAECHLYGVLHGPLIPTRSPLRVIQAFSQCREIRLLLYTGYQEDMNQGPREPKELQDQEESFRT